MKDCETFFCILKSVLLSFMQACLPPSMTLQVLLACFILLNLYYRNHWYTRQLFAGSLAMVCCIVVWKKIKNAWLWGCDYGYVAWKQQTQQNMYVELDETWAIYLVCNTCWKYKTHHLKPAALVFGRDSNAVTFSATKKAIHLRTRFQHR